jgi:acyl-CoA thioesterase
LLLFFKKEVLSFSSFLQDAMTSFSDIIASISASGEVEVPEDWRQGRTTYGGLSASLCVAGALRTIPNLPPLRSAQFTFIGPASGMLRIEPAILRAGKNTVFVAVDLLGEAGVATRALLTFGAARGSRLHYRGRPAPSAPPPSACGDFFAGGRPPKFATQFETLRAGGGQPLSAAATPDLLVWFRHRDEAARTGLLGLIAIADALPPAAFSMFSAPAPISTITWSIDVPDPDAIETGDPEGWYLMSSRGDHIADGYTTQDMALWNQTGTPLLLARQTVAIFT